MWSLLKAGKHAGRSLPQILFLDPDYCFWAFEKKVFQGRLANRGRGADVEGAAYKNSQTRPRKLVC